MRNILTCWIKKQEIKKCRKNCQALIKVGVAKIRLLVEEGADNDVLEGWIKDTGILIHDYELLEEKSKKLGY